MPFTCQDYVLPRALTAVECVATIADQLPILDDGNQSLERVYLDTFDWRLHAAGGLLLAKRLKGDAYSLIWEHTDNGKPLASVRAETLPTWPDDLPPGYLRDRLRDVVAMRALLPLVALSSELRLLRVLNEDQKTVVRLRLESPYCMLPHGRRAATLATRLTLVPVKGYDEEAEQVRRLLERKLALRPAQRSCSIEALAMKGRRPGDYSSKLSIDLLPKMRADAALRHILSTLLATLKRNLPGTKEAIDSEFLHDLRVATRRTRSALGQVKGVLPDDVVADFKQRFGWLGQVTGPTRDLDVFILDFPKYRRSLPAALQTDLDPLLPYLEEHQRQAQQALVRRLNSPHFHRLLKDWQRYLDTPPAAGEHTGRHGALPIKTVADRRIWRMYRRVLKEGRAIDDASPPEDLHELRKSCKKLRYLLEFFRSLYPGKQVKPLIRQLKRLLDNLGEFQDLHVQAGKLRGFAEDLQRTQAQRMPTVLAIGHLIGDLLQRQQAARCAFADRFAAFDTTEQDAVYRALFKAAKGKPQ